MPCDSLMGKLGMDSSPSSNFENPERSKSAERTKTYLLTMRPKRIDMARLLDDHGVEHIQASNGWINLPCPICYRGDGKFGLGWNGSGFHCFRCGKLDRLDALKLLLNTGTAETLQTLSRYQGDITPALARFNPSSGNLGGVLTVKMPYGTSELADRHKQYLISRNFDPEKLSSEWGLKGTGPVGSFAHRIIIPVVQNGKLVSFQGRDITGKAPSKYKSCPDSESVIPIKSCLYGLDKVTGDSAIVTEGPTKVWRLGSRSVCTFGATVTSAQVKLLKRFRRVFILFDEDEAGAEGADRLARELVVLGTFCTIVTAGIRDVGELSDVDAKALKRELIK